MPTFEAQVPDMRRSGPIANIHISVGASFESALRVANAPIPAPVSAVAFVDTGASITVIRRGIAARLGLKPVGVTYIDTATSSNIPCDRYRVRLVLSNDLIFDIPVIEAPLEGRYIDCLIGRDILARGVFIYLGSGNAFTLSI